VTVIGPERQGELDMPTGTVVVVLAAVAVFFGILKKHNHGWVAFAAVVLGISLTHSVLAPSADGIVNALSAAGGSVLRIIGL
jgi:hypothetical protein